MEKETKLTAKYLKTVSKKFDLETIFLLKITSKAVTSIGSVPEWTNILMLDLSKNKILMLNGIGTCINLTHLNVSYNKISSLEPLKGCRELNTLMAQGNRIKDVRTVETLDGNKYFTNLYLKEFSGESPNPIWENYDYEESVYETLPQLKLLDGQMRTSEKLVAPDENEFDADKPKSGSNEVWFSPEIYQPAQPNKNWVCKEMDESLEALLQDWKKRVAQTKFIHSI